MSNRTFLTIMGALIAAICVWLVIEKFEDCAENGGKACEFMGRKIPILPKMPTVSLR